MFRNKFKSHSKELLVLILLFLSQHIYATDSTVIIPPKVTTTKPPFVLDAGGATRSYGGFSYQASVSPTSFWFSIPKQCPVNMSPYATFAPAIVTPGATNIYDPSYQFRTYKLYPIHQGACTKPDGTGTVIMYDAQETELTGAGGFKTYWGMDVSYTVYCFPNNAQPIPNLSKEPGDWFNFGFVNGDPRGYVNPPCT